MSMEIAKIFLAFMVLINPFSALSIFLDLTQGFSKRERRQVAQLAAMSVFIVIVVFTLTGNWLLKSLGISVGAFQVGGGILVFLIAVSMVNGGVNSAKPKISSTNESNAEINIKPPAKPDIASIAVVPLAIPMMIGPGGISTVIIYSSSARHYQDMLMIILAGGVNALVCYVCLLIAAKVSVWLGDTGQAILNRIMGILLAAVAVEIIVAGLRALFPQLNI